MLHNSFFGLFMYFHSGPFIIYVTVRTLHIKKLAWYYTTLKMALPVNIVTKSYIFHHFWTILQFLI